MLLYFVCCLHCSLCIVKMFHLSAIHLSRCSIFRQGATVYLVVLFSTCFGPVCCCTLCAVCIALYVLSRCSIFRQYTCQDVPSFVREQLYMCYPSVLFSTCFGTVCCTLCVVCIALYVLSRCSIFRQYTCQDVPSFVREQLCILWYFLVHVWDWCVLLYFVCCLHCSLCIVKMLHLSAMHLSRFSIFGMEYHNATLSTTLCACNVHSFY